MSFLSVDPPEGQGTQPLPQVMIACEKGERPVEELRPGDLIVTQKNGLQPLRWIGARMIPAKTLRDYGDLGPVLIRRGAFAATLPTRDLRVSPEQRLLLPDGKGRARRFASAKGLTGEEGVDALTVLTAVYIHLLFDGDEFVLANGCWSAAFHPNDPWRREARSAERRELFRIFPALHARRAEVGRVQSAVAPLLRALEKDE